MWLLASKILKVRATRRKLMNIGHARLEINSENVDVIIYQILVRTKSFTSGL
jgi:hypothetical protein